MNHRYMLLWVVMGLIVIGLTADQVPTLDLQIPVINPENSQLRFIKNQGQWDERVKYRVRLNGGNLLLEDQGFSWIFQQMPPTHLHGADQLKTIKEQGLDQQEQFVKTHVYQMNFEGAHPHPELVPEYQFSDHHNYFLGKNPSKWKARVPLFGLLTYRDLYPGIDMRIYGVGNTIKYDLMLRPGASSSAIQFSYEGVELSIQNGALLVQTSINDMTEMAPIAYQTIEHKKVAVNCTYHLEGNTLSFRFPEGYDPAYELVIDPTLVFSTFTGSFSDNWGFTATYDHEGNAYAGGIINDDVFWGNNGYPTTLGAFQTRYQGGTADVVISKFNENGTDLLYSTYLGGVGHEQPHSLIVNEQGELYILGRTNSANFPTTISSLDPTSNGDYDIFITKINAEGTALLSSTYLGGSADDGVNVSPDPAVVEVQLKYNYGDDARGEIILDDLGNVYVVSPTNSVDFPITNGAFQPFNAGLQDGVIAKLSADLNQMFWSTYFGGNNVDAAYALQIDDQYNVFVVGGTMSSNLPATADAYQPSYQGFNFDDGYDGYVAHISNDGSTLLGATYLGTNGNDQAYLVQLDDNNDVYVYGQTTGTWPIINPAAGSVYSNPNSKQFIIKLANDLSAPIYSTTFGSNSFVPNISPTAFLVDKCENVYASGWGGQINPNGSTLGMATTADAIQRTTQGDGIYLIVLSRDAQDILYGTHFGGTSVFGGTREHLDGGTCRFDRNGVIYHTVCAGCGGNSLFPTSPSAWSRVNNSTNCNIAIFKLAFDLAGVAAGFVPRDSVDAPIADFQGCAPLSIYFENTSQEVSGSTTTTYFWNFDDNNATSTAFEPTYIFRDSGRYNVMLVINDPLSCNIADTIYRSIQVFPSVTADAGPSFSICGSDSVTLAGLGEGIELSYNWSPAAGLSDPTIANPRAAPTATTVYTLRVSNANGCQATDTMTVAAGQLLQVFAGTDSLICEGNAIQVDASVQGNAAYTWSPAIGLSDPSILNPMASPTVTTTYVLRATSGLCVGVDSVTITVGPALSVSVGNDTLLCSGENLMLNAVSTDATTYQWSPATFLDDASSPTPIISGLDQQMTYRVTVDNGSGCIVSDTIVVGFFDMQIIQDTAICSTQSIVLQSSGTAQTYAWAPALGLDDPASANPTASPTTTTTYTLTASSPSGCVITQAVEIVVNPLPVAEAGLSDSLCIGESLQLQASGGQVYQWSPASGLSDANISNPVASPVVSTVYRLQVIDGSGCSASDTLTLSVGDIPLVVASAATAICQGEAVQLMASGADSYEWSGPALLDTDIADPFAQPEADAQYTVRGTSLWGCTAEDQLSISVRPSPSATIEGPQTICLGDALTLTASGADRYLWSTGDTSTSISPTPFTSTTYYVTPLSQGCPGRPDSITINVSRVFPSILFIPSADRGFAPFTVEFLNFSLNANRYEWNFGTGASPSTEESPTYTFPRAGQYLVSLTAWSAAGCVDTSYWPIIIDNVVVHVPSAFSPNADGNNDEFYIGHLGLRVMQIKIFSRWGILIYESRDPNFRWDGTYKGMLVQEGVYTYLLRGLGANGLKYEKAGTITVFK